MTVLDARGLDFDMAFVIGLDDGSFPIYHAEDPLLTEAARRVLDPALREILRRRLGARAPSLLGKILRSRADRNAEDPFLFFLALSTPARRAVLTYPAAETNPLVRSPFIDEVVRILGSAEDRIVEISADNLIPDTANCFAQEEFLARAALDGLLDRPEAALLAPRATLDSIVTRSRAEQRREDWLLLPSREEFSDAGYRPDPEKFATAGPFEGRVAPPAAIASRRPGGVRFQVLRRAHPAPARRGRARLRTESARVRHPGSRRLAAARARARGDASGADAQRGGRNPETHRA
jgi:hypothetical protein